MAATASSASRPPPPVNPAADPRWAAETSATVHLGQPKISVTAVSGAARSRGCSAALDIFIKNVMKNTVVNHPHTPTGQINRGRQEDGLGRRGDKHFSSK